MTPYKEIRTALFNLFNGNITHNGQNVPFFDMRRDDQPFPQVFVSDITSLDESHKSSILYHVRLQLTVSMFFDNTYQSMNIVDDIGSQVEALMVNNLNLGANHSVVIQFLEEASYTGTTEANQPEGKEVAKALIYKLSIQYNG